MRNDHVLSVTYPYPCVFLERDLCELVLYYTTALCACFEHNILGKQCRAHVGLQTIRRINQPVREYVCDFFRIR